MGEDTVGDKYQCDLKIRDGAIIPLTKVMQNLTEFDHNDLTLMIRLDKSGKAQGTLYEDANEGFGYKKGEYRLTTYTAEKVADKLVVSIADVQGNLKRPEREIKIEVITDGDVIRRTVPESDRMTVTLD